jgi:hypothetical protein
MYVCMCMYVLGYSFSLQGFVSEVFRYYRLGLGQSHPNGWIIFVAFDKFLRLVRIDFIVNVFRICYHLVTGTNSNNDMRWFFTFSNRPMGAITGTL